MRILVYGAGAVGGFFGGLLAHAGEDVRFVARGTQREALQTSGLTIESRLRGTIVVPVGRSSGVGRNRRGRRSDPGLREDPADGWHSRRSVSRRRRTDGHRSAAERSGGGRAAGRSFSARHRAASGGLRWRHPRQAWHHQPCGVGNDRHRRHTRARQRSASGRFVTCWREPDSQSTSPTTSSASAGTS